MASAQGGQSLLLLEERFAAGDDRFLEALLQQRDAKGLARFTEKWKVDPRPWAREMALRYLGEPLSHAGHEPVVKRLFKHAEAHRDHEQMALFMVAFDRLVRRVRRKRFHYDWSSRTSEQTIALVAPNDRILSVRGSAPQSPVVYRGRIVAGHLFSYPTRYYLRRRAWRYFRRLGFQRPQEYVPIIARALRKYRDEDFAAGENILDNWSLMNICFRHHAALEFGATHVYVREGHTLAELSPAPRFLKLWRDPVAFPAIWSLVVEAPSRLVRKWSMALLRAEHAPALASLDPQRLIPLFSEMDEEVLQFAAVVFGTLRDLDKLPLDTWLRLLETPNPQALAAICDAMAKHVSRERLSVGQCVSMACARPTPVARLGFEWLRQMQLSPADIANELPRLADAQCEAIGHDLAAWALTQLGAAGAYQRDVVVSFFDSLLAPVRAAAREWLRPESPGYADPGLWACLLESPFDDIRFHLIAELQRRSRIPGATPDDLTPIWCAVLLGVHRGGRQKPGAIRQIADAIEKDPARIEQLGRLLAVAVRSIRGPERREGISAVAGLMERRPELRDAIEAMIPELRVVQERGEATA